MFTETVYLSRRGKIRTKSVHKTYDTFRAKRKNVCARLNVSCSIHRDGGRLCGFRSEIPVSLSFLFSPSFFRSITSPTHPSRPEQLRSVAAVVVKTTRKLSVRTPSFSDRKSIRVCAAGAGAARG